MAEAYAYDSFANLLQNGSFQTSYTSGKERDTESGLDYFGARYYSSNMGRFSSPDPSGLYYADPRNPQSLNLYSYALNNPLRMIDPSGLTSCFYGGAGDTPQNDNDASDYEDTGTDQNCTDNGGKVLSENASVNVNADYSGDITVTADGGGSSTLIQKITICPGQGNAPSPQNYQAAGSTVASALTSNDIAMNAVGYAQNIQNLYQFRPGGTFDAQKYNGGPDGAVVTQYGNYSYGEYMGSAGYSLQQAMDGATLAASIPPGKYSGQPDPFFAINNGGLRLPQRSVQPITAGYNAGRAGNTACPTF